MGECERGREVKLPKIIAILARAIIIIPPMLPILIVYGFFSSVGMLLLWIGDIFQDIAYGVDSFTRPYTIRILKLAQRLVILNDNKEAK